jgi:hypothetical protein
MRKCESSLPSCLNHFHESSRQLGEHITNTKSNPIGTSLCAIEAKISTKMRQKMRKPCFLLQTPPEIRSLIFEFVFSGTGIIWPDVEVLFRKAETHESFGLPAQSSGVLALALTCRQIHNEVVQLYYGQNIFAFKNTYDLYRYLYMIGEERRQCIRSLEVEWQGDCPGEAAELVGECISLQRLYIAVGIRTTKYTKHPQRNLWAARGFSQLREIRGLPDLDLRVREVCCWGPIRSWPISELPIHDVRSLAKVEECRSFHLQRRHNEILDTPLFPFFAADHIAEIENSLKVEMGRARSKSAEIGDVASPAIEDAAETLEPANFLMKGSETRVLRARKVNRYPRRKAGKKVLRQ